MTGRTLLPALALTLLVGACSGPGTDQAGGNGAGTTTPAPSTPGSSTAPGSTAAGHDDGALPPFPADTRADTGTASAGARGTITDVRIGHHDGFDRVVFEFHGSGTPGWTVRYVPEALGQGSGRHIDLAGENVLSVAITGIGYPTDTGVEEFSRGTVTGADTDVVRAAYFDGTFEGITQAFVGTTAEQPFRVYLLTDPARVVLEVREH